MHLSANNAAIQLSSTLQADGWEIGAVNINNATGLVRISMFTTGDPLPAGPVSLVNLDLLRFAPPHPAGVVSQIDDRHRAGTPSHTRLNEGHLTVSVSNGDVTIPIAVSILDAPTNITYGTSVHLDASNPTDVSLFGQAPGTLSYQWTVTETGVVESCLLTSNTSVC